MTPRTPDQTATSPTGWNRKGGGAGPGLFRGGGAARKLEGDPYRQIDRPPPHPPPHAGGPHGLRRTPTRRGAQAERASPRSLGTCRRCRPFGAAEWPATGGSPTGSSWRSSGTRCVGRSPAPAPARVPRAPPAGAREVASSPPCQGPPSRKGLGLAGQPDLRGWRSLRAPQTSTPPRASAPAGRRARGRSPAAPRLGGRASSPPPRTPPGGPGGRARPRPRPRGLAAATSPQRQRQPRPFRALLVQCQAPFVPHPGPPPPVAEGGPGPGPRGAAAAASPQRQQPRPARAPPRELTRAAALLPRRTR